MLLIPYPHMRDCAEVLERCDLNQSIVACRDGILESVRFDPPVLARYGLVLQNAYRAQSSKIVVPPGFFMKHLTGSPDWPDWVEEYHVNHRRFLAMLGWCRYLVDEYNPVALGKMITMASCGEELLAMFEGKLKDDDDGSGRPYSCFKELPGAVPLWPS